MVNTETDMSVSTVSTVRPEKLALNRPGPTATASYDVAVCLSVAGVTGSLSNITKNTI